MARLHHQDHENGLIDDAPRRGELGALAPRTMALFAIGFVVGAVAIGSMGIAIQPVDPPAVRPIELRSPDQRDRSGDGAERPRDRSGDGAERPRDPTERRQRGSERRERSRPRAPAAPVPPHARQQPPARSAPPAAAPRSRTPTPRTPAPRPRPQPVPTAPATPQPAPPAPAPPPADDDGDGGHADPDDDGGDAANAAGGATGEPDHGLD